MQILRDTPSMQALVLSWREQGERIAFVPTMGNLHAGHLQLVKQAKSLAPRVVVSIFVNPLQFAQGEDFGVYPRTPEDDSKQLSALGVDALFLPEEATFYKRPREETCFVEVPGLSDELCGAYRPEHFRGVTTVVNKLFNIVQPQVAIFGEKDYQQLTIIRRMAEDLSMPIEVLGIETVREPDGLAMSSRNQYLSAAARRKAPFLHQTLTRIAAAISEGRRDFGVLEADAVEALQAEGFRPDYVSVRNAVDLSSPAAAKIWVVLAAAWLDRTRLIDNIKV